MQEQLKNLIFAMKNTLFLISHVSLILLQFSLFELEMTLLPRNEDFFVLVFSEQTAICK